MQYRGVNMLKLYHYINFNANVLWFVSAQRDNVTNVFHNYSDPLVFAILSFAKLYLSV